MASAIQTDDPSSWEHVRYEQPAPGVARIVLARAEARNAQEFALPGAEGDPVGVRIIREQAKRS